MRSGELWDTPRAVIDPPRRLTLAGLFVALGVLYLATSPALVHQHWDSLEYPYACEVRAPKTIWGNHPLGHVALCGAYRTAQALGYGGRALPFMSACNAIVGATTVVTFVWLLGRLGIRRIPAVAWGLVMGGTYGFWLYAGTADIYGLSLLAMLLAWIALLRAAAQPSARSALVAAIAVGVAVVAHQFNGPLLLTAFVALWLRPPPGARRLAPAEIVLLGSVSSVIVVAGYLAIGVIATEPTTAETFRRWIIDYGADPTYGRSFNAVGLLKAMWTAGDTLLRVNWTPAVAVVRFWLLGVLVAVLVLGVLAIPRARDLLRSAALSALCQLAVGVPLIWWWAPDHVGKWWLLMLPAFVLLQATGVEVLGRAITRVANAVPVALAMACLAYTGLVTMRAMHRTDHAFDDALAKWERYTQPGDVTLESDVTAHLLFWTRRPNALFIYRTIQASQDGPDRFARLRAIIDGALTSGRSVFYVPGMVAGFSEADLKLVGVTRDDVNAFFNSYRREGPVFRYRPKEGADEREAFKLGG
jgi:hypothetical protein